MKNHLTLALILCLLKLNLPAQIPWEGLAGYWPFNGNANNKSGNNNNGTVTGEYLLTIRVNEEGTESFYAEKVIIL